MITPSWLSHHSRQRTLSTESLFDCRPKRRVQPLNKNATLHARTRSHGCILTFLLHQLPAVHYSRGQPIFLSFLLAFFIILYTGTWYTVPGVFVTLRPPSSVTLLQFVEIPRVIEVVMEAHKADFTATPSIDDIVNVSPTICSYYGPTINVCTGFGARFVRPMYIICVRIMYRFISLCIRLVSRCYNGTISESAQTNLQRLAHRGQVDLWARTKIDEAASQLKLVGV